MSGVIANLAGTSSLTFGIGAPGAVVTLKNSSPTPITVDLGSLVGVSSTIPISVQGGPPYIFSAADVNRETQITQPAAGQAWFNAISIPGNSRGLVRNVSGQTTSFVACPPNVANRLRVAAMLASNGATPSLPSGFTAYASAVSGAVLGTLTTSTSDPNTYAMPNTGMLLDLWPSGSNSLSSADVDAVAYTPTQTVSLPASFTPAGATASANGEIALLFVGAFGGGTGNTTVSVTSAGTWTPCGSRQTSLPSPGVVAGFTLDVNAGAVPMPVVKLYADGNAGTSLYVCAALMIVKPTVFDVGYVSGLATTPTSTIAIPRPGGAILQSIKTTPAMSTTNALAAWASSPDGNTIYLNGELDP